MKKSLTVLLVLLLFICFINFKPFNSKGASTLVNDLALDFSQSQFSFVDPMESWFVFKFQATNVGTNVLKVHFDQYCVECPFNAAVQAPQGDVVLYPQESMWFKIVFQSGQLAYNLDVPQTINRTFCFQFFDNNNNWISPNDRFSINKTIQIKVVNSFPSLKGVTINGVTVDNEGKTVPNVQLEAGAFGVKLPTSSDANGQFSIKLGESPVYYLIAQKEGYYAKTIEINGNNIQSSYTVMLTRKPVSTTVTADLIKTQTGKIGFWRCTATADESKLLLVNGMENWPDETIKSQSKLYLLDTKTGNILWTHNMGWEAWTADITEDGKYAVFGTKLERFQTGPENFVNYIRLLNGTDGTTIWQKQINTQNFPSSTEGEFYTRALKFSHNGKYLLVPVHGQYAYLLNTQDGSIKWTAWVGSEVREVIFSKDDQYVYVPSSGGSLYKFKTDDGSLVWHQWIGCWPYVNGFDMSSNEEYIAVATKAGYFSLIKTSDGTVKFTTDLHNGFATCRFSPDGTKILVGGGLLTMYDLNGNALWRCYEDFTDLRFSGDGKLIFTANGIVLDADGTRLYDIIPGDSRSTKIGWVNSNATRYIFGIQDTRSTDTINIIEVYNINIQSSTVSYSSATSSSTATNDSSPTQSQTETHSTIPEFPIISGILATVTILSISAVAIKGLNKKRNLPFF